MSQGTILPRGARGCFRAVFKRILGAVSSAQALDTEVGSDRHIQHITFQQLAVYPPTSVPRSRLGHGHAPEHATFWSRDDELVLAGDQILPSISPNIGVYATDLRRPSSAAFWASGWRLCKGN